MFSGGPYPTNFPTAIGAVENGYVFCFLLRCERGLRFYSLFYSVVCSVDMEGTFQNIPNVFMKKVPMVYSVVQVQV